MEEKRYDVILVGPYFCDLIFTGLEEQPRLGAEVFGTGLQMGPGGNFNTAYSLFRLNLRTGWVCDFGVDFFSNLILEKISQLGMDTSFFQIHTHNMCAVSAAFSYKEDRGFISYLDPIKPCNIIPILEEHRPLCLLVGGACLGDDFLKVAKSAHKAGTLIAMDWQDNNITIQTPGMQEALAEVDIFLPNLCEIKKLTGCSDGEEAMQVLSKLTPLLVAKLGCRGSAAFKNGEVVRVPPIQIESVLDTTGAGDCFNAGFLYGYLHGKSLEDSLKYANICGGISVTGYGVSQMPVAEQVDTLLAHYDELTAGAVQLLPKQPQLGFVAGKCESSHDD
jgi:sugar/nucleoside kinase (ribokinase family)